MPDMPEHLPHQVQANSDQIEAMRFALRDLAYLMMIAADIPRERQNKIASMLRAAPPAAVRNDARAKRVFEIRNEWADAIDEANMS